MTGIHQLLFSSFSSSAQIFDVSTITGTQTFDRTGATKLNWLLVGGGGSGAGGEAGQNNGGGGGAGGFRRGQNTSFTSTANLHITIGNGA